VDRELVAWLVRFGAPLLFFAQVFGIFGLPIPDELLLTVAGALVASGRLSLSSTIAAAVSGCLTGVTSSYAVGGWVGLPVLRARFRRHHDAIERAQNWFQRFGDGHRCRIGLSDLPDFRRVCISRRRSLVCGVSRPWLHRW
jgi:membrane protein DedA with SNARE-associated domain